MNFFSQCGDNTCLWILLLLLLTNTCGNNISKALNGASTPILLALLFTMWKNGTLSKIFCGTRNICGCNG